MCENETCRGYCKKNGRRRPESCPRQDFTPLTMTISTMNQETSVETAELTMGKELPTPAETVVNPRIAA